MQIKKVYQGSEAREKMFKGFKTVADVVASTAGPSGRNVAMQADWGGPKVTKDGVTVAKSITFLGAEGEGAKLLVQAADKTNKKAGDGTTATCIIAKAIAEEGFREISTGRKSTEIKKGIDWAVSQVVKDLKAHSKEVKTNEEIRQLATVSANNDTEIGDMIAKAVETIGRDGVITVEEARGLTTELEVVDGLQFDQGYLSPYFMTNPERQLVEFENPYIFLYDGKINTMASMVPLLEVVAQTGRPIVIVADEVDNEPLTALVVNHMKGALKCCAVKAPSFGDIRKFIMEDIATLTGGQFISTSLGQDLEKMTSIDFLGTCDKIKISPVETTIIGGHGSKESIEERVAQLKEELENTESSYDKEKLRERIARLQNGIAIIKVGGATEVEVKEKKDRVDDAVCATRAALEEGILPGGGVSLLKAKIGEPSYYDTDFLAGVRIVEKALSAQIKTIAENSGKSGDVIVEKVLDNSKDNDSYNYGYNARTNKFCNMVEAGILDATKVVRCAIENGASVAGTLLTIENLVIDDIEENAKIMSLFQRQPQM